MTTGWLLSFFVCCRIVNVVISEASRSNNMCDGMKILSELKVNLPELKCKPGNGCWCENIKYKFDMCDGTGTCMSPKEMLDVAGEEMGDNDRRYLRSLLKYKFNTVPE